MKKILIINEATGQIVAYTTITGLESDWGLTDKELIEARIQYAIDDEVLEENVWYQYYETKRVPKGLLLI